MVYYLTFLEVLGCLSLSIALWDIPWVDFKAEYYEEIGIAATDHIKRAGHVLSVDTAGVQVPHYIYCLPSLPQKEQAWHLHVSMRTPCSGWACIRQTPAFLPSYQRASLRQCAPQRCPVLVLTVVLDNHKGVVCIFSQLRSGTRLELTLEYISALKAGSRKLSLSWLRYLFFCMVHS